MIPERLGLSIIILFEIFKLAPAWAETTVFALDGDKAKLETPVPSPTPSASPTPEASPSPLSAPTKETPVTGPSPMPLSDVDSKPAQPLSGKKKFTVQVGAYNSLRKAALLRSLLKEIGPVQVERIHSEKYESIYRVLVGEFDTEEQARRYLEAHHFKDLFKNVWINAISLGGSDPDHPNEIIPEDTLEQDPYVVNVNLQCTNGRKYGTFKTELKPDEKDIQKDVDLKVQWNCISDIRERWLAKDELRSPSHVGLSALVGMGSLDLNDTTLGALSRSDFAYGLDFKAFRSFGGIGPTFEYRLINHRYTGSAAAISPQFFMTHRFLVGARLPISHRFEFQPTFGYFTHGFLQGATANSAVVVDPFLSQVGIRFIYHFLELEDRTWFDLIGGYNYILPSSSALFTVNSGYDWSAKIQTSHFNRDNWGLNWFFEYSSRSITTPGFTQGDSLFLLGVSALCGF